MRGDALAVVEHLDRSRRDACPDLLAQQRVRHRVVVLSDLDVGASNKCATARAEMPRYPVVDLRD